MTTEDKGQEPEAPKGEAQEAGANVDPRMAELEKQIKELRKEAASYRTRAKELEGAQEATQRAELEQQGKYKELLDAEKSERAKLALELAGLKRTAMQQSAASAAGLPLDLAPRLIGDTDEELLADAKAMAKRLAPASAPNTGATNPAGSHGQQPARPFDPKAPPRLSQIEWKK